MIIFNIDKLLAERKMHSVELARRLDCTVQTVSRLKTGKSKALRLDTLDDICRVFECQPADVLEYISEEEAIRRYGKEFVENYNK